MVKSIQQARIINGHGSKEQGRKQAFVRFSEQYCDITLVWRERSGPSWGVRERFPEQRKG
jgi:hypothetical protein